MCLFKQYLTGLEEEAVKHRVTLSNGANVNHEDALKSYCAIF